MAKHQKINHFPKSYEITRKDLFYHRIARMIALYGERAYDFVPKTFFYPSEIESLKRLLRTMEGAATRLAADSFK